MTASVESIIAAVIADNSVVIHDHRDYGDVTASTLTPDEMAAAVMAALTEVGTVEWGVRDCFGDVDEWRHKENAEIAAKAQAIGCNDQVPNCHHSCGGQPPKLVSRSVLTITGPWQEVAG